MSTSMSEQSRRALATAAEQARRLGHDYVGTEHVLLGLVEDGSGLAADVLEAFGVTPSKVRSEVERLVTRGSSATPEGRELPLTPRARRALDFAAEEARLVSQQPMDAEYLLLGLLREDAGVAGEVLRTLGMKLDALRGAVHKIRMLQMTIVERAVRPVRATTAWKRSRREELLAHLTEIYDEEQAERNDPIAAVNAAADRFGDPAELARELDAAVSSSERLGYYVERWFAWRAPETLARYAARLAVQTLVLLTIAFCFVAAVVVACVGWHPANWELLRVFAALLVTAPPAVGAFAWLHIKVRNAMWGAFGNSQSLNRALGLSLLLALVGVASAVIFTALVQGAVGQVVEMWPSLLAAMGVMPLLSLAAARLDGQSEIRDAVWALLRLSKSESAPGDATAEPA
jgi:hypothetical protein